MTATHIRFATARQFMPYFAGQNVNLHFSHTASMMYCQRRIRIGDEVFEYVEARWLDEESKKQLDAMPVDDYVGAAALFGGLCGDERTEVALDEAFRQFRVVADERSRLSEELSALEVDGDEYRELDAQLDLVREDVADALSDIQRAIQRFNQASGYDPMGGMVTSEKR